MSGSNGAAKAAWAEVEALIEKQLQAPAVRPDTEEFGSRSGPCLICGERAFRYFRAIDGVSSICGEHSDAWLRSAEAQRYFASRREIHVADWLRRAKAEHRNGT